jgi:hypothetical protein
MFFDISMFHRLTGRGHPADGSNGMLEKYSDIR